VKRDPGSDGLAGCGEIRSRREENLSAPPARVVALQRHRFVAQGNEFMTENVAGIFTLADVGHDAAAQ
jgi:hypothetical protein